MEPQVILRTHGKALFSLADTLTQIGDLDGEASMLRFIASQLYAMAEGMEETKKAFNDNLTVNTGRLSSGDQGEKS